MLKKFLKYILVRFRIKQTNKTASFFFDEVFNLLKKQCHGGEWYDVCVSTY